MKLPFGDRATIEDAKLREYSLSSSHPRGRHKAKVFAAALEITVDNRLVLAGFLERHAAEADAAPIKQNEFGEFLEIRALLTHETRAALLVSVWLVQREAESCRLVTRYVYNCGILRTIQIFDVVALTADRPGDGLVRGQFGAVVEVYSSQAVEVEFTDSNGRMFALLSVPTDVLLPLRYEPADV